MRRIIIRDSESQELKEKGNKAFLERDYPSAIVHYTAAIKKSPKESVLYSNRSRCYYMVKDYINSIKDSKISIDLDRYNIKAYLLYSRGLANISKQGMNYNETELALRCCKSAYQICKSTSQPEYISTCKSLSKKLKILIFLKKRENYNYQVSRLKSYYKGIIKHKRTLELFDKFLIEKKTKPVPENLCCPITLELFSTPIINETGSSYESNALVKHFSKMGYIDPITRRQIDPRIIIINNPIVLALKWYLKNEPWAKLSETVINSLDIEL
jgi:tetratricopeptide (TPR) repeat protein